MTPPGLLSEELAGDRIFISRDHEFVNEPL